MALYLPRRWRQQPQGLLALDDGHPLAGSIEFAICGSQAGVAYDLAKRERCQSGASDRVTHRVGRGFPVTTTEGYGFTAATYRPNLATDQPLSLVVVAVRGTGSSLFMRMLMQNNGSSYGWSFGNQFYGTGTDNQAIFGGRWGGATSLHSAGAAPWPIGDSRTYALTAAISGSDYSVNLWADGRRLATDVTAQRDPGTDSAARMRSWADRASPESCIPLAVAIRGVIPAALAEDLSNHPWQLFKPRRPIIISLAAAGGAYTLNAEAGSYTLTGAAADLLAARELDAGAGSYTLTGADASLVRAIPLNAEAGSYTLTGSDATLRVDRTLDAEAGSYAVTGADAELVKTGSYALDAEDGSYAVTGADAELVTARVINAEAGSYDLTGADASLLVTRLLNAEAGSYIVTGADATLQKSGAYVLDAEAGSYVLTGAAATLLYSGETSRKRGVPGPYRYAVRIGGRLFYANSPQAIEQEIRRFEASIPVRAEKRAQKAGKVVVRRLPQVRVIEAPKEAREQVRAVAHAANDRIASEYMAALQARVALGASIEAMMRDDDDAAIALEMV